MDISKNIQIINFPGHSHFSLIDERSIYQKDYTAIQTQSLSYIELEKGKVNGSILIDEFDDAMISTNNSMRLICDVNDNAIVIKRISFEKNEFYGDDWIIDIPINKNNFNGKFKVKIYAIESFGKISDNYIEDNVIIQ